MMHIVHLCYFLSFMQFIYALDTITINTNNSEVTGTKLFTIYGNKPYAAFWKIPYAEPPVSRLRFKDLREPMLKWDHKSSTDFSSPYNEACSSFITDDCLYLSIFQPLFANNTLLPVLVWLHDYSHSHGPDFFIDEEVLVVIVSFRVGILGFLNTDDDFAKGNMGAKDIIMALRWIRENITKFNGNPNKVTVSGSGTTASIVASVLLSSSADDLFSRAIIQSGSAFSPADYRNYHFEVANKLYLKLDGSHEKFDRTSLYNILSNILTSELLPVSYNLFDSTEVRDTQRLINSFGPSVETSRKSYFINQNPKEIYNRKMINNNAEVMMGYTSLESIHKLSGLAENRELLMFLNYNFQYLLPFEGKSDEYGSKRYNEIMKTIKDFFFLNGTITKNSLRRYTKYMSDQITYPLLSQAKHHSESSSKHVYLYRFPYNGALNVAWNGSVRNSTKIPGATSGDEICYLFRCKSVDDLYSVCSTSERLFIKKITRLWANFVKFGDPTSKQGNIISKNLIWYPFKANDWNILNLNHNMKIITAPEVKRFQFWDQLRKQYF